MAADLQGQVVPSQLNYSSALPIAIESRSNRRLFYPNNGTKFGPDKTRRIRMNINSDSLLDFTHSYFQMEVDVAEHFTGSVAFDQGVPFIDRVQIQCNGQDIEDIQNYNRLHAMLMDCQGSKINFEEWSTLYHEQSRTVSHTDTPWAAGTAHTQVLRNGIATDNAAAAAVAGMEATPDVGAKPKGNATSLALRAYVDNATDQPNALVARQRLTRVFDTMSDEIKTKVDSALTHVDTSLKLFKGALYNRKSAEPCPKRTYNFPLVSCLFNLEKYFPMIMVNQGIDVIFHFAAPEALGVWTDANAAVAGAATTPQYSVNNVRFVAHEVQLDNTFYDILRSSVAASNWVLSMAGTTWRHYLNSVAAGSNTVTRWISPSPRAFNRSKP